MRYTKTLLTSLALVPALVAFAIPLDEVTFHPSEGLSVTRTIKSVRQFTLDDMEMTMNGQPLPMNIQMDMDMSMNQTTVVTDVYGAMADGRHKTLTRTFDELGQTGEFSIKMEMMPDGGQDKSITGQSELEGTKLIFEWDAEENAYKPRFDGEGNEALLEGLDEDMDLRVLLPPSSVSEGDTWSIDVKKLRSVLAPGGNLKILPDEDDSAEDSAMPGMDGMSDFAAMFSDLIEGDASGEFRGMRDIDGVKCAVIGIKIDVRASVDLTEKIAASIGHSLPEGMGEMEVEHVDFEIEIEGEGQLYWDVSSGIANSFEMTGKVGLVMDMGFAISTGEQSMTMEQNLTLSGTYEDAFKVTKN